MFSESALVRMAVLAGRSQEELLTVETPTGGRVLLAHCVYNRALDEYKVHGDVRHWWIKTLRNEGFVALPVCEIAKVVRNLYADWLCGDVGHTFVKARLRRVVDTPHHICLWVATETGFGFSWRVKKSSGPVTSKAVPLASWNSESYQYAGAEWCARYQLLSNLPDVSRDFLSESKAEQKEEETATERRRRLGEEHPDLDGSLPYDGDI